MKGSKSSSYHGRWAPPGWPWELEVLTLVCVAVAFVVPLYILAWASRLMGSDHTVFREALNAWNQGHGYLWMLVLLGLYFIHSVTARLTLDFISTPVIHMFSPALFGAITYGRLLNFFRQTGMSSRFFEGSWRELIGWILILQLVTIILARVRMRRHLARFKDVVWDITVSTSFDRSYLAELAFKLTPIVYPPRRYRACGEGILVEGWTYVMPLPFYEVEGISPASRGDVVTSAFYAASSMRSLLRIKLYDRPDPIFISPGHPNLFFRYCEQLLAGRSPAEEERRAAERARLAAETTPYGEPTEKQEREDLYYNV